MKVLVCHDRDLGPALDGVLDSTSSVCSSRGGGLGVYLSETISGLRQRGVEISSVEFDPNAVGEERLTPNYLRLRSFRFRYRHATVAAYRGFVEQEQPDAIHLHNLFYEICPSLMRWLVETEIPLIWTLHDVRSLCYRGTRVNRGGNLCNRGVGFGCISCGCHRPGEVGSVAADLLRVSLHGRYLRRFRQLRRVLVPSAYMREALIDNGFDAQSVEVTPLFSRFQPELELGPANNRLPRILFVGRLDREKGVEQFIAALGLLVDQPWEAIIVGDGPQRVTAEQMVVAKGIQPARVRFAGSASGADLAAHYRNSDFVVFSSMLPESFGMVGVEAMSFGKPVAGFAAGGVLEWLHDEHNGLLAIHGDVPGLAKQMRRLLSDSSLREKLGQAAVQMVSSRFTLERHLDQLQSIYHRTIKNISAGMEVASCTSQPYPC